MAVEVDLIVEAIAKGFDKLEKGLKDVGTAGDKSEKGIEKAGKQVGFLDGQIGKLVTGGALLAAGKALLDFGKASITAASDVEEMQSKFNTVFRDLAGPVTAELEQFAEAANRSKFDLMGFAATLQDTFVPLGFARDEAANMSVELVKLAEDLASFNNLNTEDVVRDLQSALVGNTETLRKYGVVAQETQIKQEAINSGLWDGVGVIDAQAKAQAILQLALKGTTDARGDAIKTADSYANTTKGLEAAFTDLKVVIGQELLPLMGDLARATTEVIKSATSGISVQRMLKDAYDSGRITLFQYLQAQDLLLVKGADAQAVMQAYGLATEETSTAIARQTSHLARQVEEQGRVTTAIEETRQALLDEAAAMERDVNRALLEFSGHLGPTTRELEEMAYASGEAASSKEQLQAGIDRATGAMEEETKAAEDAAQAERDAADAAKEHAATMGDLFTAAIESKDGIGLFNETAAEMADRSIYVSDLTGEQRTALQDLQAEYEKAQGIISDYTIGAKGVGLTTEEVNEKVAEQQERMAELQGAMDPLLAVGGEYADVQGTMTINQDALNQAIYDSADAQDASAEQLAILGGALGLYSDEAVEAALKSALVQAKIDELTAGFIENGGSVEALRADILEFVASLDEIPGAVNTDISVAGVDAAISKVGSLQSQLNALGGQVSAADAAGAGETSTGDVYAASGADFIVPPGYPNDSFGPIWAQSGEHVKITPNGASSGMGTGGNGTPPSGGGQPVTINVYQRPGENGRAFADRVATLVNERNGNLK